MRRTVISAIALFLLAFTALYLIQHFALASSGGSYDLSWWTVDGGGHTLSTDYTLGGTVGQPDAGVLSGGDYTLGGGFWGGGAAAVEHEIYLPLVLR
jgi:hypothetical protein